MIQLFTLRLLQGYTFTLNDKMEGKMKPIKMFAGTLILLFGTLAFCGDTVYLGTKEYREVDDFWYKYSGSIHGDKIDTLCLVLRKTDGTKPTLADFSKLNVTGIEIDNHILLGDYYCVYLDSNETRNNKWSIYRYLRRHICCRTSRHGNSCVYSLYFSKFSSI